MIYRILADLVLVLHLAFIVFALLGGVIVWWRRAVLLLHIPAACWAALVSFKAWVCPLTPLENHFRQLAGAQGYSGGFVEHYILPIIYPVGLDVNAQMLLGTAAIIVNLVVYSLVYYFYKRMRNRSSQ